MRNIIVALILSVSSLSAFAGPRFGFWTVNYDRGDSYMVNSAAEQDGSVSQFIVNKSGLVSLSVVPPNYNGDENSIEVSTTRQIITVNGVRVKFKFSVYSDGLLVGVTETAKGNTHLQNELWSKNRVNFVFPNGNTGWFSAQGVQKAWRFMQAGDAI